MTSANAWPEERGCPSGLEPPAETAIVDPAPFVEKKGDNAHLNILVFGAKCAGCISKIEGAMAALPEMSSARLNLSTGRLSLDWRDGAFEPVEIMHSIDRLGYRAAPFDPEKAGEAEDAEGRRLIRALAVAGFATANIMLLSISVWAGKGEMGKATVELMHFLSMMIAIPAVAFSGRPFFRSAWGSLRHGRANMDVPISLAVILATGMSLFEFFNGGEHTYFDAAVMLLFFLLIGRYLDHRLRQTARAAARNLIALQAMTASRIKPDGSLQSISARAVAPGDMILLSPGDRAPVDGVIAEGSSDVDMSLVTGESAPARLNVGDVIHSGVVNMSMRLVMRAQKIADESLLADLTRLVEAGEQAKSRYVQIADKAAALYVPVVHSLAAVTFLGWFFIGDAGLRVSLMNAIAVLIITCPCALGLAAPAVQIVATGRLFKRGVLVKTGDALERFSEVDAVVFDKTGTLTEGKPRIANREEISDETLMAAASLARISRHPLSRAVIAEAGAGAPAKNAVEMPGKGVEGEIDGVKARFGAASFVGAVSDEDGQLEAWFRRGEGEGVRFRFEDGLRKDAKQTIAALQQRGLAIEILSGDRESVAREVAGALGVKNWRAGLSPLQKIERLDELKQAGVKVAMVGDGLNDAPALASAHVSLSPGSAADASQAAADFVYQGDTLAPIADAYDVSGKARRRMLENFGFAALYNVFAMPLAALGFVTPLIAAVAMSSSSIIVTLNALRLAAGAKRK